MKESDSEKTSEFFNTVFATEQKHNFDTGALERLFHRDKIFIKHILPHARENLKILDFGCGQGKLLSWMLENGYNAVGMELNEGMRKLAEQECEKFAPKRVLPGGVEELAKFESGAFDMVVVMGVFQYLSAPEYEKLFREANRLLSKGGKLIATFQNAFFDLFTFNKYTIDFMLNFLLFPEGTEKEHGDAIRQEFKTLLTNPDKPEYAPGRARDNIFVRTSNPVTIHDEVKKYGFELQKKYYYEIFGLPPLIASKFKDTAGRIKNHFEIDNAESWQCMFMANAFLTYSTKIG